MNECTDRGILVFYLSQQYSIITLCIKNPIIPVSDFLAHVSGGGRRCECRWLSVSPVLRPWREWKAFQWWLSLQSPNTDKKEGGPLCTNSSICLFFSFICWDRHGVGDCPVGSSPPDMDPFLRLLFLNRRCMLFHWDFEMKSRDYSAPEIRLALLLKYSTGHSIS